MHMDTDWHTDVFGYYTFCLHTCACLHVQRVQEAESAQTMTGFLHCGYTDVNRLAG